MSSAPTPAVVDYPLAQGQSRHRVLSAARLLATVAIWAAAGFGVVIVGVIGASPLVGYRTFTVSSGSMRPGIAVGDLVVTRPIAASEARVGDVVTFADPEGGKRLITHRVRRLDAGPKLVNVVTKGDATNAVEKWHVPRKGTIGRVEYRVPRLGLLFAYTSSPFTRLALIVAPALLLAAAQLKRIWRS